MSNSTKQVTVPDIGDADGVEVIEFCVQPGDVVALDDALLVIESDKASMEIQSTVAGVVASFSVALGDVVTTGQAVAEIQAADSAEAPSPAAIEPVASEPVTKQETPEPPAATQSPADTSGAGTAAAGPVEVRLPDIGDAGEVVVIELGVSAGDSVQAEQMLLVVESDKASMDIVAPVDGVVAELKISEGDSVGEDALLVVLNATQAAAAPAQPAAPVQAPQSSQAPSQTQASPQPPVQPAGADNSTPAQKAAPAPTMDASGLAPPPQPSAPPPKGNIVYAGPAVRRMARELGVDLTKMAGTGARGRIVKDDVSLYVKSVLTGGSAGGVSSGAGIPSIPEIDFAKFGDVSVVPMSRILKRGADNLHRSWLNVVHVTQHDEADITELEEFRKSLKPEGERRGVKITPLAFIAKACAHMLTLHPKFNSSLDGGIENLIQKSYINIGFAVDTPDGLLVPVVRDADKKGVWELAEEINELATKARDKKLSPKDLQGGTFSISSLGSLGGTGFTPIVNAPEVAILGVAKLAMKPQWDGSTFVPRKMLPISLSYDHRAINGAEAGRFATELCALLGDMRRAML